MYGNLGKKFSPVEVILRRCREPDARRKLVAFLLEVTALIDLSQKYSEGNVVGDIPFNARHLPRGFVEPDSSFHFGKDGCAATCRSVGGTRIQSELKKFAIVANLFAQVGENKRVARLVDEIHALLLFLRDFLVRLTLLLAALRGPGERVQKIFQIVAIGGSVRRRGIETERDVGNTRASGKHA